MHAYMRRMGPKGIQDGWTEKKKHRLPMMVADFTRMAEKGIGQPNSASTPQNADGNKKRKSGVLSGNSNEKDSKKDRRYHSPGLDGSYLTPKRDVHHDTLGVTFINRHGQGPTTEVKYGGSRSVVRKGPLATFNSTRVQACPPSWQGFDGVEGGLQTGARKMAVT